jgi:hypothetical protein
MKIGEINVTNDKQADNPEKDKGSHAIVIALMPNQQHKQVI